MGEFEGQQYFSMDYVEGKNLAQSVAESPMRGMKAARLVQLMAEAIQYAHQRGILHRDLKPQNVLLDEREQPRITDFGLAKRLTPDSPLTNSHPSLTHSGAVMGSPGYMASEQATGRQDQIGPPTDVYGLGAILYHLLTGRAPFSGATAVEKMVKVVEAEPISPGQYCPGVSADLETVCLKCLEKRPERRYVTGRALAEDLKRFLNPEPVLARPAGLWFAYPSCWLGLIFVWQVMRDHQSIVFGLGAGNESEPLNDPSVKGKGFR
ncbi:MAG: serine/threonine-protein kinase [Limisphaerales bacterium]